MFIENKSTNTSAKKKPIWCSENTFPSCDWYIQQENMAPRGRFPKWNMMGDVMKHRKMIKNVVKGSKILGKLGLTAANIASAQADNNRENWAIAGEPYGPGNMAQNGMTDMIELPKELLFSELQTKITEKVNKF